jgi:hypothetical protein
VISDTRKNAVFDSTTDARVTPSIERSDERNTQLLPTEPHDTETGIAGKNYPGKEAEAQQEEGSILSDNKHRKEQISKQADGSVEDIDATNEQSSHTNKRQTKDSEQHTASRTNPEREEKSDVRLTEENRRQAQEFQSKKRLTEAQDFDDLSSSEEYENEAMKQREGLGVGEGFNRDAVYAEANDLPFGISDRPTWTNDSEKEYQLLHYFLQTGELPWWNTIVRNPDQLQMLWERQLAQSSDIQEWLAEAILNKRIRQQIRRIYKDSDEDLVQGLSLHRDDTEAEEVLPAGIFRQLSAPVSALLTELWMFYRFLPAQSRAQQLAFHFRKEAAALAIGISGMVEELQGLMQQYPVLYFHPLFAEMAQWFGTEEAGTRKQQTRTTEPTTEKSAAPKQTSPEAKSKATPSRGTAAFPPLIQENAALREQVEALLQFLQSGQLAAVNRFGGMDTLLTILYEALKHEPGILYDIPLMRVLLSNASGRERLGQVLSSGTASLFLELTWPAYQPRVAFYLQDLERLVAVPGLLGETVIRFQQIVEIILVFATKNNAQPFLDEAFTRMLAKELFGTATAYQQFLGRLKLMLMKRSIVLKSNLPALLQKAAAPPDKKAVTPENKTRPEPELSNESKPVFIENAGLILTWPFLPFYFTQLGMLQANRFVSNDAAYRAVHLLEYLCSNKEHQPEYKLVLNKLLAGVDQAKPISLHVELKEEERALSETLLQQLIARWDALGKTSTEGLRESFLKRPGKLSWIEGQATLQVEKRPFDMLLDRIPWNISHIKLSWMNEPLKVNWR